MKYARAGHAIVPLEDGNALVLGGTSRGAGATKAFPEIYDTKRNTFEIANGSNMGQLRMLRSGRFTINGYLVSKFVDRSQLVRFVGTWRLLLDRGNAAKAILLNGQVLVAGGQLVASGTAGQPGESTASAELYSPDNGTSELVKDMIEARAGCSATVLKDGRVFLAGGERVQRKAGTIVRSVLSSTEIFNPKTKSFAQGPQLSNPRAQHSALLLKDGRVLLVGGQTLPGFTSIPTAEIFDPRANTCTAISSMKRARRAPTLVLLRSGDVLVVGGNLAGCTELELFDPITERFLPACSMSYSRVFGAAGALECGKVLISGGYNQFSFRSDSTNLLLRSSELFANESLRH
jgi:hypothetical protein